MGIKEREIKHYFPTIYSIKERIDHYRDGFLESNTGGCYCGVHFAYYMQKFLQDDDYWVARDAKLLLAELVGIGWEVAAYTEIDDNKDIIVTFKAKE